MKIPLGFRFAGVHAGIKPNRRDLALIVSETPCTAAGCFTQNAARAWPVLDAEARLPSSRIRALVVNSGNANALTGPEGKANVQAIHEATAAALKLKRGEILSASTGVIGRRMPVPKIVAALPKLVDDLTAEPDRAAEAILTTDTVVKMAHRTIELGGCQVTISAIAKGSGMIAPSMATMIAAVVTDCAIEPAPLMKALRAACDQTFNCLTVDGDMSTNDCVFALANGAAKNPLLGEARVGSADFEVFGRALTELCDELARAIAADGEGATKLLTVRITDAASAEQARELARAVTGSSLVKAALFGADPNWGRILAAAGARAGTAGYPFDLTRMHVTLQGIRVFEAGRPLADGPGYTSLKAKMREPQIEAVVSMGSGNQAAQAYGCDLSYDYVKINADYTALLVDTPGGGIARDDRLENYTPGFKASLLLEVLSYIDRLKGQRCVVKYGGAAMVKDSLKKSFCDDLSLLHSLGLRPVVVHGGGPEITRMFEKLGHKAEFIDGRRVTSHAELKVVEMVLTGSINTELVSLLNRNGSHAVGVSGKDGALLRARKLASENGRDLGQVGEVTEVNTAFLDMLLSQGYLPVISPVGLGQDGEGYNINADDAAAAVAVALKADKLIFLSDVAGVLENGELISEITTEGLAAKIVEGVLTGGMRAKAESIIGSMRSGVGRVHVIDGRMPHSVIGELFTDRGVGTLVTP